MQNKKLITLIVLSVAAVISLVYGIFTPAKGKRRSSAKPPGYIQPGETLVTAKRIITVSGERKKSNYFNWGRSPFMPPKETLSAELKLNGIVWDKEEPQAVINSRIVGIGSKIAGNMVIEIKRGSVILNDGMSNFELILGGEK